MPLQWPWKSGPRTVKLDSSTEPCYACGGPTYMLAEVDSDGNVEMFAVKCPKCGVVRGPLYSKPRSVEMNLKLARRLAEKG